MCLSLLAVSLVLIHRHSRQAVFPFSDCPLQSISRPSRARSGLGAGFISDLNIIQSCSASSDRKRPVVRSQHNTLIHCRSLVHILHDLRACSTPARKRRSTHQLRLVRFQPIQSRARPRPTVSLHFLWGSIAPFGSLY